MTDKPMTVHSSAEGKTYTRRDLIARSKDELIDLILILNIRLSVAKEEIDRLNQENEEANNELRVEMSLNEILRLTGSDGIG